jgi:S-adenosylmethionine hydrolase
VPDFNAHAGALLLDALSRSIPAGAVFVCVVDPGVGAERDALVIEADGRWYVGPDNGLLSIVLTRSKRHRTWKIHWRPQEISVSFHGRDLFAPMAGWIASGHFPADKLTLVAEPNILFDAADLPRILYVDHFGNAWTGIRGGLADAASILEVNGKRLAWRRVYAEAAKGEAFWYVNSAGLVEIAVNRGNAAAALGLKVGDLIKLHSPTHGSVH